MRRHTAVTLFSVKSVSAGCWSHPESSFVLNTPSTQMTPPSSTARGYRNWMQEYPVPSTQSTIAKHPNSKNTSRYVVVVRIFKFLEICYEFFCLTLAGVPSQQQTYERGILCVICQHSQTRMEWPRSPILA